MLCCLAGLADPGDFDDLAGAAEPAGIAQRGEGCRSGAVNGFGDIVTSFTQHKDADFMTTAFMVLAGNKGIQAFNPVNRTGFNKFRQGPVDLQRRPQPLLPERVKNVIGASRLSGGIEIIEDEVLVSGSAHRMGPIHTGIFIADDAVTGQACQTSLWVACVPAGC